MTTDAPATCEAIEPLLQADLDGELTSDEQLVVVEHLSGCAACTDLRAELGEVGARLQEFLHEREADGDAVELPELARASGQGAAPARATAAGEPTSTPLGAPVLAGYRVGRRIARGGFGEVWRAVQLSLDRPVAIKVLAQRLADDEQFVARFLREARLAGAVSHPNLVQIYEVGRAGEGEDGPLFFSMELVDGSDVEAVLGREGKLDPDRAARIGLEVARALEAAAAHGIVHRDIKPANILLTGSGGVKLADLGLAKATTSDEDGSLTLKKTVIGSPNYMSPEQAKDIRATTARSDIYSLGATLLHMVTGVAPFGSGAPVEILARVLSEPAPIPDDLPPALRVVLARCMEKDPAARYASAAELRAALEAAIAAGAAAVPAPNGRRTSRRNARRSGKLQPRSGDSEAVIPRRRVTRARGPAIPAPVLAAAAALLIGVAMVVAFGGGGSQPTPEPEPREVAEAPVAPAPQARPAEARPDVAAEVERLKRQAALKEVEELEAWAAANGNLPAERYRRAAALVGSNEGNADVVERAERVRRVAAGELAAALEQTRARAREHEAAGRLWEARQAYATFAADHGEGVPGATDVQLALSTLESEITARLATAELELETLLAQGDPAAAEEQLEQVASFAGPAEAARLRGRHADALAEAIARATPAEPAPAESTPAPEARPESAPAEQAARELLATARKLLEAGDLVSARAAFERATHEGGQALEGELAGELAALTRDLEAAEAVAAKKVADRPLDEVLAALVNAKVELLGERRVRLTYDFEAPEQEADWRATPTPSDLGQKIFTDWLLSQPVPKAPVEPWKVHKGLLVGYGHGRVELLPTFAGDEELSVEVESKRQRRQQNLLVALAPNGKQALVAGLGYELDALPLAQWTMGMGAQWARNKEVKKRLGEIERTIEKTQERGPSVVVFREESLYRHAELLAKALDVRGRKVTFTVGWKPGDEGGQLGVVAGRKLSEAVTLQRASLGPQVKVRLQSYGAPVGYEAITVTGTLSKPFVAQLREAEHEAQAKGGEPAAIREAFEAAREREAEARDKKGKKGKKGN